MRCLRPYRLHERIFTGIGRTTGRAGGLHKNAEPSSWSLYFTLCVCVCPPLMPPAPASGPLLFSEAGAPATQVGAGLSRGSPPASGALPGKPSWRAAVPGGAVHGGGPAGGGAGPELQRPPPRFPPSTASGANNRACWFGASPPASGNPARFPGRK